MSKYKTIIKEVLNWITRDRRREQTFGVGSIGGERCWVVSKGGYIQKKSCPQRKKKPEDKRCLFIGSYFADNNGITVI